MEINYILCIALLFSSAILLNISVYSLKRREVVGAFPFGLLMLAFCVHSLGYAFEILHTTLSGMKLCINIEYIGVSFFPFLLLLFIKQYADEKGRISNIVLMVCLVASTITLILVLTNGLHHLYYASLSVDYSGAFPALKIVKGPWYYVQVVSLLSVILYSIITNFIFYLNSEATYRMKALYLLLGSIAPAASSVLYLIGWGPGNIDISPFAFLAMGLFSLVGIFKYNMFDYVPVTYKKVFESIDEGVMVLDDNDNIINVNPVAIDIFNELTQVKKGHSAKALFEKYPEISLDNEMSMIKIDHEQGARHYQLKKSLVMNKKNKVIGKLLVFNDVTKEHEMMKLLKKQATEDALTGLYNRRYFLECCKNNLNRQNSEVKRSGFILMDVDFFKKINDNHGHLEGDKALRKVAKIIENSCPEGCVVGRYGGEEFAVQVPEDKSDTALELAEIIRENVESELFTTDEGIVYSVTASFGIYVMASDSAEAISAIFKKADQSLYIAKANGRNQTIVYGECCLDAGFNVN